MLWLVSENARYRIFHCDLCCEEHVVVSMYRNQPINLGDYRARGNNAWDAEQAWKFCGCEKGFGRWETLKDWLLPQPKHPYSLIQWCDQCGCYGGSDGKQLQYIKVEKRMHWRGYANLCRQCRAVRKTLQKWESWIDDLKRVAAS